MTLDVPVCVHVPRIVGLGTGNLDLLETPLREVDIAGSEVAPQGGVLQSEGRGQGPDLRSVVRCSVTDDLDNEVILFIPDRRVAVA